MNRLSTSSYATVPDEDLMTAAADGDERAFDELFRRLRPMALGVARQICGTAAAEDAVQAAFLSAWTAAGRFQASRGTARSWILSIVRNRSIDSLREQRRRGPTAELEFEPEDPARTESIVAQQEVRRDVLQALNRLPDDQRRVLELAYYAELSQSEIATELRLPLGTVKGRARLGLRKLPGELSKYAGQPALAAA